MKLYQHYHKLSLRIKQTLEHRLMWSALTQPSVSMCLKVVEKLIVEELWGCSSSAS